MRVNNKGGWDYKGGINPVVQSISNIVIYAPHAETLRSSLVVKTGRKAVIRFCNGGFHIGTAITTDGFLKVRFEIKKKGGETTNYLIVHDHSTGLIIDHEISSDMEIPLDSGDTINVYTENLAIGGTVVFHFFASLIEFDY